MSRRNDIKDSFKDYFRGLIGEKEFEDLTDFISNGRTRRTVRVNTLKISKANLKDWLVSQGYEAANNPFSSDAIDVIGEGKPLALKLPYLSGFTYPQDSSSMFAVELLKPQPGETIIDLTAAPGGKTTHIAQRMKNTGVLIANDMDTSRLKALHSNLERLGVWNTAVIRMMPHKIAEIYAGVFDKVLLDPSCSGEGLLAKGGKPSFWSPKAVKRYASEQFGILKSAYLLLKPGGTLVYSTCTLNEFEDDGVVKRLLTEFPEADIADSSHVKKYAPEQVELKLGKSSGFRFWPHKTRTKGFFCVAIRKGIDNNMSLHRTEHLTIPGQVIIYSDNLNSLKSADEMTKSKCKKYLQNLGLNLPDCEFTLRENYLFCISRELSNFPLPKAYSLAFPLLKIFDSEIKPSHEGAIYLGNLIDADLEKNISCKPGVLELGKEELDDFLERKTIEQKNYSDGNYLAKYKIFPLGLAKVRNGKCEIPYPTQY